MEVTKHKWVGLHCRAAVDAPGSLAYDHNVLCSCKKCLAYTGGQPFLVEARCADCGAISDEGYCGLVTFNCGACGGEWKTDRRPSGYIFPTCRAPNCDLDPKP